MPAPPRGHSPPQLPIPDPETAARSAALLARVSERIAARGGPIPFAEYMELVLYAPGLGYYAGGLRKFGAEGDFVTAPEIAPLFSRCLARQCAEVLAELGGGEILEFGAGSGAMAAGILGELRGLGCEPERYGILEVSGELRARQRETLAALVPGELGRVQWLDRLPESPLRGVVLANEVLDAMPVERFRIVPDGVHELQVDREGERLIWAEGPAGGRLAATVERLQQDLPEPLAPGYSSEVNPTFEPWLAGVADVLDAGAVLLIDYGYPRHEYYHPERATGTLMCHYRHHAHSDPLILPGLQDITAYVDFTAVAQAGVDAGLRLAGYTTQAHFLLGAGLTELLADSDPTDVRRHLALTQQVKTLTLPGEMGERFKALAFTRGFDAPLAGFALRDLRDRL
ncbi:hypothetical protein BMS3Bbin12_00179 [bacterium BMS3Bbin12]|nr:hypothetical protein BMS3Abin12_00886 [bacterium BMS3Abin12]GBE47025.1 hypothetical protein BMS3Bbin12_00179 [bacterium BMS3Bbin12]GBE50469.1 hypothetical protein BMS3Bbin13_01408 [bacterium BMS3Bbin13]HDJ86939.1 SAM-dependent methyltransferase [Chromatiales bacterium]HDK02999.1 SAM-dependent methyltransferase [Gammaproteobacteria bacterium]